VRSVRRLVQHALAATGISVLTAGAVVGSLSAGPANSEPVAVSAPSAVVSATPLSAAAVQERDNRSARTNRSSERLALSAQQVEASRAAALLKQRQATAEKEAALVKKKKAAEAKKEAERKKKEEQRKKKEAERKKEKAEEAARAKRQGYEPGTTSPKSIARQIMDNKYGWGDKQFSCYNNIIMRESMWVVDADNPTSSAYGIPQALPGSKMASEGSDWRTNPATQIKWGLGYVKSRYGTPCEAWGFKSSHGWY
jgi:murein DD-endopeptidase MepM/ murein hydrolase activator NlpD